MSPFCEANELVNDIDLETRCLPVTISPDRTSLTPSHQTTIAGFLQDELWAQDLETLAPHLWVMTTPSSANINALHRQIVKNRKIIITEESRLHLVWIHDRIFIKPLPRYLLSHRFWKTHLDQCNQIRLAATGFLRTYRYLVQHESDFNIAQQDHLGLISRDISWQSFRRLMAELSHIKDSAVSQRYYYGELRLTRLNFYAPFLLRKFHFEQLNSQYGDFFARLYGPILFVFALASTILNAMQVQLATEQLVAVHWESMWYFSRWFSTIILGGAAIVCFWISLLWLWMFSDEWIYTLRQRNLRRRNSRSVASC